MNQQGPHSFAIGDRVRHVRRPGFPAGTVLKPLTLGFVLVRWDNNALETAHSTELAILAEDED